MRLRDLSTIQIVQYCLRGGKESEICDFKQEWHEKIEDLIKDIICFANTVHDENCYIIFGVSDNLKIVGMSKKRRIQADIIDSLSNLVFAGDISPKISVETITLSGIVLDVLVIDNVECTPIYLNNDYGKMKKGCIYTRVEDRNTPDNGNANINQIEKLWKKRLGLTKPPYEFIIDRLQNPEEWKEYDGDFYNIYKPEFRLHIRQIDCRTEKLPEFYAYTQSNPNVYYSYLDIIANNTILDTYQIVYLDGGRLILPVPEAGYIYGNEMNQDNYMYRYYIVNDSKYRLLEFMYNSENLEQKIAYSNLMKVVLQFNSEKERKEFENYINGHLDQLRTHIRSKSYFTDMAELKGEKRYSILDRLKIGDSLNKILLNWRKERYPKEHPQMYKK